MTKSCIIIGFSNDIGTGSFMSPSLEIIYGGVGEFTKVNISPASAFIKGVFQLEKKLKISGTWVDLWMSSEGMCEPLFIIQQTKSL